MILNSLARLQKVVFRKNVGISTEPLVSWQINETTGKKEYRTGNK